MTERGDSDLAELDRGCYGELSIEHQRLDTGYPSTWLEDMGPILFIVGYLTVVAFLCLAVFGVVKG